MRPGAPRWQRVAAAPALHFLLLGGLLLGGERWLGAGPTLAPDAPSRTILVTQADRERLLEDWRQQWGRVPTADEARALVRDFVDDEVLVREARARGLDRNDRVVRTRLAQLASFVGGDGGEDDLVEEARRLGLDQSDLVVRRYLVQAMRLVAARPARDDTVREEDVAAWFERHSHRFRQPERIDLVHVYLSRDRRGARLENDAGALLERLRRDGVAPEDADRFGDPFIRGAELSGHGPVDLERAFGPAFAEALGAAPAGEWTGPVASAYGLHLVWIRRRTPPGVPPLDAVRNQVVHGLLEERRQERLARRLDEWRRRYVVIVEGADA